MATPNTTMFESEAVTIFKIWFALSQTITLVTFQYFEANKDGLSLELNAACVLLQQRLNRGGWQITGTELEPKLERIERKS